jgi:hypothetical protein
MRGGVTGVDGSSRGTPNDGTGLVWREAAGGPSRFAIRVGFFTDAGCGAGVLTGGLTAGGRRATEGPGGAACRPGADAGGPPGAADGRADVVVGERAIAADGACRRGLKRIPR